VKTLVRFVWFFLLFTPNLFGQSPFLWERQRDFSGRPDRLQSVSAVGNMAVTAGNASVTGGLDLAVVNYSGAGAVRWTDQLPLTSGYDNPVFTASLGAIAFAAGYSSVVPNNSDIFLRAYNSRTGNVLWHDTFDKGRDDFPQGLGAGPFVVVVVGQGGNTSVAPITALDALIRAYDPLTGRVLWEDQVNKGDTIDDIAWAVAIDFDQVFVAGTSTDDTGKRKMLVRAYHARTGALQWEVERAGVSPTAITTKSGRVFVAGSTGALNAFMGAFNTANGGLVWEDTSAPGIFVDVAIRDHRLVGVGRSGEGSLIRAYHPANGKVAWQDVTKPPEEVLESLSAVALSDEVAYVTGVSSEDFGESEFVVRAYDLSGGQVLFDDRSHRSGGTGAAGTAIALGATHVYAVGWASDGGPSDFLIRAYDRTAIEPRLRLLVLILGRIFGLNALL